MPETLIKNIVIVGGGTAGWMAAAALGKHFGKQYSIRLVESDDIATVGVGEATIPPIREFNRVLEIDEAEFMRATNATIKLGIQFENWGRQGDRYIHPFGVFGAPVNGVQFHHYWQKLRGEGQATTFADYNLPGVAAEANKFSFEHSTRGELNLNYYYAYHFDATLYARYLRNWSEQRGVVRTEGKVVAVNQNQSSGDIQSITLESGEVIEGDLFIDCTGFRALLIEQTLHSGFDDWSHWLQVDRAWAVTAEYSDNARIPPYTRTRALEAGWQWRVPLQNRTGNGHVFCSRFISEERAREVLLENIEGKVSGEPRLLRFTTGKRKLQWNRNCIAVGLSGGFLEPLESTSIHLIQASIIGLINHFPVRGINAAHRDQFNLELARQYEEARNFLILHYYASERDDSEFWLHCRNMSIPDELAQRIELFRKGGFVLYKRHELFVEHSWLAVMLGQGILPEAHDARADRMDSARISDHLARLRQTINDTVERMPTHEQVLADYCAGELKVGVPSA